MLGMEEDKRAERSRPLYDSAAEFGGCGDHGNVCVVCCLQNEATDFFVVTNKKFGSVPVVRIRVYCLDFPALGICWLFLDGDVSEDIGAGHVLVANGTECTEVKADGACPEPGIGKESGIGFYIAVQQVFNRLFRKVSETLQGAAEGDIGLGVGAFALVFEVCNSFRNGSLGSDIPEVFSH